MSGTKEKKLNLPQSLLLLLLIIVSVAVCIRLKTGGPMIGLFASWIFIYLFCKIFGISYAKIVAGAYDAIRMVVPTLCLLMAIGVMIGTWLQSGTIATIISWGLKMINPSWLLPLTLLFCSILSILTGTSDLPYNIAGKTGTAEHGSDGETPHSWFVGFSNADDPDIVIAVVAENGGYSSEVAVPIARQVIEAYYAQQ